MTAFFLRLLGYQIDRGGVSARPAMSTSRSTPPLSLPDGAAAAFGRLALVMDR